MHVDLEASKDVQDYIRFSNKSFWRVTGYWQVLSRMAGSLILGCTSSVCVGVVLSGRFGYSDYLFSSCSVLSIQSPNSFLHTR